MGQSGKFSLLITSYSQLNKKERLQLKMKSERCWKFEEKAGVKFIQESGENEMNKRKYFWIAR